MPNRLPNERCQLEVKDFGEAIKELVDLLRANYGATEGKTQVFLCLGWDDMGLGGSAILKATANLLKYTICDDFESRKNFGRILNVDCTLWKNRRTMQRAIAEELNLHHVMHIFDDQDDEDDFRGVDDSSRGEISSVGSLIHDSLRNERFLMFFHYGGVEDIDLLECGIPTFGKGKLIWTNSRRFYPVNWRQVKLMPTSANMYISFYLRNWWYNMGQVSLLRVLHEEAVGVIGDTGMDGINPKTVLDCFRYSLFPATPEHTLVDYDWATHACNYWICDGILGDEKAWDIGNALYGVVPWLDNSTDWLLVRCVVDQKKKGWYSIKLTTHDISSVPHNASSYFLTFKGHCPLNVHNDLFQLASNNLRVLMLCNCSFDFESPPFQCCHNLRFLWLDHCANTGKKEQSGVPIFLNLMVFDSRFTYWVLFPQMVERMTNLRELNTKGVSWKTMSHACRKLHKLHKLRVTESPDVVTVDSCSVVDMMNLELLDLSGNTHMESLPALSSARCLKMLVLDGCSSLENIVLDMERAPPLLESFSFDGYGPTKNWTHTIHLPQKESRLKSRIDSIEIAQVTNISLRGCGRLQNIFLHALPNLEELDLSGTSIRTLDLGAMDVPKLKKLFLLGCEQLRSVIWADSPRLEVLQVDTQAEARSMVSWGEQGSFEFQACIAFTDARFTWSFIRGILNRTWPSFQSKMYLLISCMIHTQASITKSIEEIGSSQEGLVPTSLLLPYNNISLTKDVTCSSLVWNHRQLQTLDTHIEIGEGSYNLDNVWENRKYFAEFLTIFQSLHVHDNSSITTTRPRDERDWNRLEWCHVERCPKLHVVFSSAPSFTHMKIFSASDLLVVYCIWNRGINNFRNTATSYLQQLQHMYLYNCPRMEFALPICFTVLNLETLQIAYCGNLRHVFPLDNKYPREISPIQSGVTFLHLKQIKLYHLHKLEQICETKSIAPSLQTIGLRDCWALRRLPAVAREGPKPVVDCEKDWWNKLEWDGLDAGHHPSLFETRHSAYYKKTLPRVSFLR